MKRFLKILSYFILGLIVFTLVFAMFTQTPIFKNWLKNKAIEILEAETNGKYELEKLKGNLFNYVQLENLKVKLHDETILSLDRVFLQYDLTALFVKNIVISKILLEAPNLVIRTDEQGVWNFNRLSKSVPDTTPMQQESEFGWNIALSDIEIRSGNAMLDIASESATLPNRITDFDLTAGGWVSPNHLRLRVENIQFNSQQPDLQLHALQTEFTLDPKNLGVEHFTLKTGSSYITSDVEIRNLEHPVLDVLLKGQPLALEELRRFLPALTLHGTPRFDFEAHGPLSNLDVNFNMLLGDARCTISGNIHAGDKPYRYDLTADLSRFNLADVLNDSTYASHLNLGFRITGEGIEWGKIRGSINMQIDSSRVMGHQIEPTTLVCRVRNDSLDYVLNFFSRGADAKMKGKMITGNNALTYSMNAKVSNLDLSRFVNDSLKSDLNLLVELDGQGTTLDSIAADLFVQLLPSSLSEVAIDSARVRFDLNNGIIDVREFEISSPAAQMTATGDVAIRSGTNLRFDANFSDFSVLSHFTPLDSLGGSGRLHANLFGPLDSLKVDAEFDFHELRSPELRVVRLSGSSHGTFASTTTAFDVSGYAHRLTAADISVDSTDFTISYIDSVAEFEIHLRQSPDLQLTTDGEVRLAQNLTTVEIEDVEIRFREDVWQAPKRTRIELAGSRIRITDFRLTSLDQSLTLDGYIDTEDENAIILNVNRVDVNRYISYLDDEIRIDGLMNLNVTLAGELATPEITTELEIREGQYYHVPFRELITELVYKEESVRWNTHLSTAEVDKLLESSGTIPMRVSLSHFTREFYKNEKMEVKFNSRGIDLSIFEPFVTGLTEIRGRLTADIALSNTFNDLIGSGTIRIVDGQFRIPELGTKYTSVSVALALEEKNMNIIDLRMRSGDGFLQFLEGGLSLSQDEVSTFTSRFRLQNFQLINNNKMRARARGRIELTGNIQAPRISGKLEVDEAIIHYKKWLEEKTPVLLTSKPFFVIAPDTIEFDTSGAIRFQKELEEEEQFTESQFYKNLRGQLSVEFLRNSWIRSSDTNIEVTGGISVVKETEDFVLQGNLSTSRGYYNLLGNRFQIEKGNLRFTGDPDINASVDITAVYRFLDQTGPDPRNREFKVLITGSLYEPQFQFLLDDVPANQEDMISILLFGQPASASRYATLTGGGPETGEEDSDGIGDTARGILTSQTLNLLGRKLGEELNLDVIEIESGKNVQKSRVRIGKYLTPEVFVSLSQPFGSEGNQKVELEYAIPHEILFFNLLIQAVVEEQGDSGADIIWKIEW